MAIITISRGSYSRGKGVAQKLATVLGYECASREILLEASKLFDIREAALVRAVHDAPTIFERWRHGKKRYVAYVRAALLSHLRNDNVVYHGNAGHFFVQKVPGALKVRIIANMADRIEAAMHRDQCSSEQARDTILKDDEERSKWSLRLYGIDSRDLALYDMVLNLTTMTVDDAVDLIAYNARLPCFQLTPESLSILGDLALEAQAQAALVEEFPEAEVSASDGAVFVDIQGPHSQQEKQSARARKIVSGVDGVGRAVIQFTPLMTADYLRSLAYGGATADAAGEPSTVKPTTEQPSHDRKPVVVRPRCWCRSCGHSWDPTCPSCNGHDIELDTPARRST